jgi:hypothetical protein
VLGLVISFSWLLFTALQLISYITVYTGHSIERNYIGGSFLTRKYSNIICPVCNKLGGSLKKEWVDRSIHIPRQEKITDIPTAWGYASKVLQRMREELILIPPEPSDDTFFFTYKHFTVFTQHTEEEIKAFESRHLSTQLKTVKSRQDYFTSEVKDIIHLKLPDNSGQVSKSILPILYGAIVCLALKDLSYALQKSLSNEIKQAYGHAIFTYFSWFVKDARYSCYPITMIKIMQDVLDHGYHGAAALNSVHLGYCSRCSKRKDGNYVQMEKSKESLTGWRCLKCGSTDSLKRGFTPKHLRNMQCKMFEKLTEFVNYNPLFLEIRDLYIELIKSHHDAKEDFQKLFNQYDLQASKDLLSKRDRWVIVHTKSRKKSKCHIPQEKIADIEIDDPGYSPYKRAIADFGEALGKAKTEEQFGALCKAHGDKITRFFEVSGMMLMDLGWPEAFITNKIINDITSAIVKRNTD